MNIDLSAVLAAAERYIRNQHALEAVMPASMWLNIERAALAEHAGDSVGASTFRMRAGYT